MVLCSHCRKVLFTESREEEVEESGINYRLVQLKFYFSSKRETMTGLGFFFPQMIICFSSSFF